MPAKEDFNNLSDWNSSNVFYKSAQHTNLHNIVQNCAKLKKKKKLSRLLTFIKPLQTLQKLYTTLQNP
jgi:hypothetical protein